MDRRRRPAGDREEKEIEDDGAGSIDRVAAAGSSSWELRMEKGWREGASFYKLIDAGLGGGLGSVLNRPQNTSKQGRC